MTRQCRDGTGWSAWCLRWRTPPVVPARILAVTRPRTGMDRRRWSVSTNARHCIALPRVAQDRGMPETAPDRTLRILVVDDHDIVRQGIAALLERQPGYEVVAQAGTAAEALTAANRFAPDLVILDVSLPDGSGIETCREIKARRPETRVVILTGSADEDTVLTAVVAGANGYLLKSSGVREVMHAIDVVAAGGSLLDPVGDRPDGAADPAARRRRRGGSTGRPRGARAPDPRADRRGPDQQGDRGRDQAVGEDRQALGERHPRPSSTSSGGPRPRRCTRAADDRLTRLSLVQRSVELGGVVAQPASPDRRGPAGAPRRPPRTAGRARTPAGGRARG